MYIYTQGHTHTHTNYNVDMELSALIHNTFVFTKKTHST